MIKPRVLTLFFASLAFATLLANAATPAPADDKKISFEGKTIKLIVPTTTGGSTDIAARLVARFLGKYLPGSPIIVASNVPSGHGVAALNFIAQQAVPDGLTITISSISEVDP